MRKNRIAARYFFYIIMAISLLHTQLYGQHDSVKRKSLLLLPVVSRSIETGWSFGAVAALTFRVSPRDTVSRTSNLEAIVLYSTKKQLVTAINGTQFFHHEKFILNEQFSFSSFPDKFWGLGKNTPDEAEEPYKFNQYYIYLHLHRKIANGLFIGMMFENQKVWDIEYIKGGIFDQQHVAGRSGYSVSGLGGSMTYDTRNNAFASDRGFYGQLFINYFDTYLSSDYTYSNIVVDLRKYFSLGRNKVFALQLYNFNTTGTVPLRSLAAFGGANRMRGYYEGRYRDLDQLLIQGEYRFNIYKRFGAVAFAGTGSVANSFSDYALNDLRYSYGAGIRFALDKKEKLNIRVDYGIGQGKNHGFYLQLGEAF